MFINRDYKREPDDDFKLNVQPHLDRDTMKEALPITKPNEGYEKEEIVGWKIQNRYE